MGPSGLLASGAAIPLSLILITIFTAPLWAAASQRFAEATRPSDLELTDATLAPTGGAPSVGAAESRMDRLTAGVRGLRVSGGRIAMGEHTLMILGGIIARSG